MWFMKIKYCWLAIKDGKNLYSCLLVFVEQNESAEESARREVYEEVGLDLKKVNYKYSQYWPFTNNLMLGFEAKVKPKKI